MPQTIEYLLIGSAALLLISVFSSKASDRVGVPSLLLFLLVGMFAGSEGPGGIEFDNAWLAQLIGVVSLIFILFAGGLDTQWAAIRPVLRPGMALSTVAVLMTAGLVGAFTAVVLKMPWPVGLLLGAVISSTDAAAVFAVLRSKNVNLSPKLRALLEFESGSNDPMAVFLTLACIQFVMHPETPPMALVGWFLWQLPVGALCGLGLGRGLTLLLNRITLGHDGLYPVLTGSAALLGYGVTTVIGGNGFLAVYTAGLVLGHLRFRHKRDLLRFHDGLAWLAQIVMFLTLGLLVFPSHLAPVIGTGLLVSLFLMGVARPAGIFATLWLWRFSLKEQLMVSWVGLRGAVPIVLATFPMLAGVPQAELIFNVVFFIVLTSTLLQGASIAWVARRLGVDAPLAPQRRFPIVLDESGDLDTELLEMLLPYGAEVAGKALVDLNLAPHCMIVLISRNDRFIVPNGSTILEEGDVVLALVGKSHQRAIRELLLRVKQQPADSPEQSAV